MLLGSQDQCRLSQQQLLRLQNTLPGAPEFILVGLHPLCTGRDPCSCLRPHGEPPSPDPSHPSGWPQAASLCPGAGVGVLGEAGALFLLQRHPTPGESPGQTHQRARVWVPGGVPQIGGPLSLLTCPRKIPGAASAPSRQCFIPKEKNNETKIVFRS